MDREVAAQILTEIFRSFARNSRRRTQDGLLFSISNIKVNKVFRTYLFIVTKVPK